MLQGRGCHVISISLVERGPQIATTHGTNAMTSRFAIARQLTHFVRCRQQSTIRTFLLLLIQVYIAHVSHATYTINHVQSLLFCQQRSFHSKKWVHAHDARTETWRRSLNGDAP